MKHWLFVLLLFTFSLHANVVERYYFSSAGKAFITSDAPLELIKASSEQMAGIIDPVKKMFGFKIPVASFKGFNSDKQKNEFNQKFMESDKFPDATFTGKLPFDFSELKKGMQEIRVSGLLKIHGVTKERTIPVSVFVADQVLVIHTKFSVSLDDHDIEVPAILFRKLAPEIKIELNSLMKMKFGAVETALAAVN
jgi:hypothetical protein